MPFDPFQTVCWIEKKKYFKKNSFLEECQIDKITMDTHFQFISKSRENRSHSLILQCSMGSSTRNIHKNETTISVREGSTSGGRRGRRLLSNFLSFFRKWLTAESFQSLLFPFFCMYCRALTKLYNLKWLDSSNQTNNTFHWVSEKEINYSSYLSIWNGPERAFVWKRAA